ncbi:hypothetical protein MESS2_280059 [Mesorhizobium metallidurans STM 2683]|uniref:Uncharacterized protein n=1 Tax=Mesorhizobium metallidurans STM 2683 TaxID=1297569 RepID=M5F2Y0_9HYPH|nr:hypothetical protein MESS2_280059 [Mesorhizobium metallidurans STM 2683]
MWVNCVIIGLLDEAGPVGKPELVPAFLSPAFLWGFLQSVPIAPMYMGKWQRSQTDVQLAPQGPAKLENRTLRRECRYPGCSDRAVSGSHLQGRRASSDRLQQ